MLGAQNRFLEIAIGGFSRSADLHPAVAFAVPHRFRLPDKPLFAICFPQVIIPIPATCAHLHPPHPLSAGTCIADCIDTDHLSQSALRVHFLRPALPFAPRTTA